MIKFVEEKRKITVYDDILEMLLETDSITIDNSWCVCVSREPSLFVPALRRTERTKKKAQSYVTIPVLLVMTPGSRLSRFRSRT